MLQHQQQHPSPGASPGTRRRSDGSVRECLFFPVLERNEQERLEAMVRRRTGATGGGAQENMRRTAGGGGVGAGGDPQDPLENRPKRWTWGGPPDGMEGHPKKPPCHAAIGSAQAANELPPASSPSSKSRNVSDFLTHPSSDQPVNKRLSNSSATLHSPERASSSAPKPHRSSSNRRSVAAFPEENPGGAWTPTTESPTTPVRSASFRSQSKGPGTPKRVRSARNRPQSPCSPGQYPPSPLRQRAGTPGTPGTPDDRGLERKISKTETSENKKIPKSTSRDLGAESPGTPTGGRSFGGTTDAEEAGRLLAERRRLARVQKEQEERQRQEEERLRAEEEQRRQQEERERQERAALLAEEEKGRREEERKSREEEERRMKERRWKDMQDQLDREREEAFLRAQREAERKRQERELLHIQEEQERLQRKKRIEEIMKRTRKSVEIDMPPAPVPELRSEADVVLEEEALLVPEPPVISLGPLEAKSCVDELSDGVQSMDVSPVSRDEQASAQDFSPVTEGGITEGDDTSNDARTLEHLLDLAAAQGRVGGQGPGQQGEEMTPPSYPKLGDLNKNLLIQACNAAASESSSQLIHSNSPGKLDVQ